MKSLSKIFPKSSSKGQTWIFVGVALLLFFGAMFAIKKVVEHRTSLSQDAFLDGQGAQIILEENSLLNLSVPAVLFSQQGVSAEEATVLQCHVLKKRLRGLIQQIEEEDYIPAPEDKEHFNNLLKIVNEGESLVNCGKWANALELFQGAELGLSRLYKNVVSSALAKKDFKNLGGLKEELLAWKPEIFGSEQWLKLMDKENEIQKTIENGDFQSARKKISELHDALQNEIESVKKMSLEKEETEAESGDGFDGNIVLPNGAKLEMLPVKAGTFQMGSPLTEQGRFSNEIPHSVRLTNDYWLGKYEVTQGQWKLIMGTEPSEYWGENRPVEQIRWEDAENFCRKMNELYAGTLPSGYVFDLPTEAQWEYAGSAGNAMNYHSYRLGDVAWYDGNSGGITHDVGLKTPNLWGFYDMLGNVHEYCKDWYVDYPINSELNDPLGYNPQSHRVYRGGGKDSRDICCRYACRHDDPSSSKYCIGFRLALVKKTDTSQSVAASKVNADGISLPLNVVRIRVGVNSCLQLNVAGHRLKVSQSGGAGEHYGLRRDYPDLYFGHPACWVLFENGPQKVWDMRSPLLLPPTFKTISNVVLLRSGRRNVSVCRSDTGEKVYAVSGILWDDHSISIYDNVGSSSEYLFDVYFAQ